MRLHGRNLTRQPRARAPRSEPSPYHPSSPGYAERSALSETDLGGGVTLISVGEPPARHPSETQAVPVDAPEEARAAPVELPATAPPIASAPTRDLSNRDFGLSKQP